MGAGRGPACLHSSAPDMMNLPFQTNLNRFIRLHCFQPLPSAALALSSGMSSSGAVSPITFLSVILVSFLIDLWNAIMIASCNDILLYSYPRIRYATRDTPRTRYIATGGIEEIMVRILY